MKTKIRKQLQQQQKETQSEMIHSKQGRTTFRVPPY